MAYILRTTLVLCLASAATRLLRRQPAALRHIIWTCAFVVIALVPALMRIGPIIMIPGEKAVTVPIAITNPAVALPVTAYVATLPASRPSMTALGNVPSILILWIAGILAFGIRLFNSWNSARRLVKNTIELRWPEGVPQFPARLAESDAITTAMTIGVFRPQIILPVGHRRWDSTLLSAVLEHEISHARRRDCLSQLLANIVCITHWFNPLAWIARSEMVCESERACDDSVVRSGVSGRIFARDLLAIAQQAQMKGSLLMSNAVTTKLESRITRLMDTEADRSPMRLPRVLAGMTAAFALLAPIASIRAERTSVVRPGTAITENVGQPDVHVAATSPIETPTVRRRSQRPVQIAQVSQIAQASQLAQSAPSLAGVVHDPSGAIVPGAAIYFFNTADSTAIGSTVADATGRWAFSGLASGTKYAVEVRAAGFKVWRGAGSAGAGAQVDSNLVLGEVTDVVTVVAPRVAVPIPPAPQAAAPGPIRVGGNVQPAKLINMVKPIFPPSLRDQGVDGVVRFQAVISKTGLIQDPRPLPSSSPSELVQAASDAIRQWQFEPTRLNGQPVEVLATIDVVFQLQ